MIKYSRGINNLEITYHVAKNSLKNRASSVEEEHSLTLES